MKAQLRQFTQSQFVRNVAIVATGTAGAQAITMAFAPFITRLYGPEAFGLLGVFMALVMIIAPIAALTYPIAIVLPKKDRDAKGLAWLSFYIALGMSCFIATLLFFWGEWLLNILSSKSIIPYMMLLPISMFFAAILQIAEQWLIRKKHFKITAKVAVYKAFIVGSLQTGIGLIKPIGAVLIVVATIGSALQALMLFNGAKKSVNQNSEQLVNNQQKTTHVSIKRLADKHKDFPLYRAPQVFINAVSLSLPVLMLASFFGPASAGFYSIAISVLGIPAILLGKSVGDVFYQRVTEATHNNENITRLLIKATVSLAILVVVPFVTVIIFGPWLFSFVFGNEWHVAGEYAQWLALWLFVSLAARPAIAAIPAMDLQSFFLIHEAISALLRAASLFLGFVVFENDIDAVIAFSITNVVIYGYMIFFVLFKSKTFPHNNSNLE
jgi:O-antigen/teichoic acid export membrane protein